MIKTEDLIRAVRELAAESPYAVYEPDTWNSCEYTRPACGNGSGCLIGQAIVRCDPDMKESLVRFDDTRIVERKPLELNTGMCISTRGNIVGKVWLASVQASQDNGATWSDAVAGADWECPNEQVAQ
jgi:hypothetical protein